MEDLVAIREQDNPIISFTSHRTEFLNYMIEQYNYPVSTDLHRAKLSVQHHCCYNAHTQDKHNFPNQPEPHRYASKNRKVSLPPST